MTIAAGEEKEIGFAMLPTAVIRLEINGHVSIPLRALCDTGSQANLINDRIIHQLQWPTQQCKVRYNGVNGTVNKPITRKLTCKLLSRFNDEPLTIMELMVAPQNFEIWLPQAPMMDTIIPEEIFKKLADPEACMPAPINIILGAAIWAIVVKDSCLTNKFGIAFQPSCLGWLIFGGGGHMRDCLVMATAMEDDSESKLDTLLRRFWEMEEVSVVRARTLEQEKCEDIFMRSYRRLSDGRFQVDIPMREDISRLGSSRAIALHRYRQLEKRFQRDPAFEEKYTAAINDLLKDDQLRLADRPPYGSCYHIPHHAVLKKFRIVNDATCSTDLGMSLNEAQLIGEKLQDDLSDLIMRFRCHPVAITADIRKMFLQVRVNPKQWDLQRIFWRPTPTSDIKEYWLTSVTFGMASAPHCAVRAMIQGARELKSQFPLGAAAVEHDFYMDDCLTGAQGDAEAKRLCHEMDTLLRSCGFVLDKWQSNRRNVVPNDEHLLSDEGLELSEFSDTTVLGLRWLPNTDQLMFKFQPPALLAREDATKRRVLSHIAQIFDPNGYIGPVVIVAKILMQKIWNARIGWDALVPIDIFREWQQFQRQLPLIAEIKLPRWLGICNNRNVSLHGFADASTLAYGAVLYARVETAEVVECILIAAKSHVAPLKTVTVPRLELCAAQLLSELLAAFRATSKLAHIKATLWSDSQIVLAWLTKDAATLKIFVNNRVQKIQRLAADADWRYVPSAENPADLLSRGMSAAELPSARLWWHGPEWLIRSRIHWPPAKPHLSTELELAIKKESRIDGASLEGKLRPMLKECAVLNLTIQNIDLLSRASNANALFRLTAWVFRFIRNARSTQRRSGGLLNKEIIAAQEYWLLEEQHIYYAKEIKALNNPESSGLDPTSPIARFNPFIDGKGVLRMSSRLDGGLMREYQQNPALLPDISQLAKLLINEAHERTLHGGPRLSAAYLRQKYWITNLRRAIRTNSSRCIECVKQRQQVCQQLMGKLPSDRVEPYRAFKRSGVDYAGPFMVKARSGRCNIKEKKYVAVFVCMVTKAVHLELAESLSTEHFIEAFQNFTSIRGVCERLWSDNGKNFEGAASELREMLQSWDASDMGKMLQTYGTEWRFITPYAPHQGGLWEAAVKSMKHHLNRIVGPHHLTSSQFRLILNQISAVMNSRPISAISDDPNDLSFLTPAHFLIGEPIVQPFGANVADIPNNRLSFFQQRQKMTQAFWKVWTRDYLNELQQRPKWQKAQPNLKPGDLVIVKEDNAPPTMWKSARVVEIFPGKDGLVRNVAVQMATSDWNPEKITKSKIKRPKPLKRPVQKLCRLPVEEIEAERSRAQDVGADTDDDVI